MHSFAAVEQLLHPIDYSHGSQCWHQTGAQPYTPEESELIRRVWAAKQDYVDSMYHSTGPGRYPTTVNLLAPLHSAKPINLGT